MCMYCLFKWNFYTGSMKHLGQSLKNWKLLLKTIISTGDTQYGQEQIATEAFMFLSICLWSK